MLAAAKRLSLYTKEESCAFHFTVDLHVQRAKDLNSVIPADHFLRSEQYIYMSFRSNYYTGPGCI